MRTRRTATATAITAALLLCAACGGEGSDAASDSSEPFKAHALLGISGNYAAIGGAMKSGMEAAVQVINDNGGVLGSPMELEVIDTTSVATEAVAKAQQLLSEGEVKALFPGTASSEISAVVPVMGSSEVFVSHHGAGIAAEFFDTEAYPYVFCTAYQPSDQATSLVAEFTEQGFEQVAVVSTDDVAGEASYAAMEEAFGEAGIASEAVFVPTTAVDVTAQVQQVMDSNPDVLLIDTYGPPAGPALEARAKLGIDIPAYSSQYMTSTNIDDLASESELQGLTLQALSVGVAGSDVTQTDAFVTFNEALQDVTGGELPFSMNQYVVAYNDVILAATAANLAGSTDAAAMAKALEGISPEDAEFIVGPTDYTEDRHVPTFSPEHWSFVPYGPVEDGLIVPGQE